MAANSTCFPAREAVSNGLFQHDNPIKFALPLLIIQVSLVLAVTRSLAFLFKPFRQPRVLAEIIGGVLLGPSGLGRQTAYLNAVFPKESLTLLESIATLGLLFFLFMIGLELDLNEIRKSGRNSLLLALSGIGVPFIGGIGVASLMHDSISAGAKFAPLVVFTGVPISITAFPVLVRIMAERKLLSTELGKMVIPAAALNDVCAWILLAVGVAISGPSSSPAVPAYVLLSGVGYVVFMLLVTRRLMEWIAHRVAGEQTMSEIYVCITMVGVLIAGFTTDAIGIHPLFGAFVFGLTVPKEGTFAQKLIEKIEDFITVLMLPLFFASSGLKTNLGSINSARSFGFLILLILTAGVGKISATVLVALSLKMQMRTALACGFLMNTKGLVELIVLNIGKDLGVFNDQDFAILVLMCLVLMFLTTPAVMALYKPARNPVPYVNRKLEGSRSKKDELRILACVHGTKNIPALLNLVDACRGTRKRPLKLFALHLIEFSERTSSAIMTLSRARHEGQQPSSGEDNIFVAFEAYGRLAKVPVRMQSVISELADMHEDICSLADEKRATIIILPFNFYQREDGSIEYINSGFRTVNQKVLHHAPCSVGILVDKGLWGSAQLSETRTAHKVAVLFFGGPDDREALAFACRLAKHPNVKLWVLRFLPSEEGASFVITLGNGARLDAAGSPAAAKMLSPGTPDANGQAANSQLERSLDDQRLAAVREFSGKMEDPWQSIFYEEHTNRNPVEAVVAIGRASDFSLFLVGRGVRSYCSHHHHHHHHHHAEKHAENSELGPIGDALANAGGEVTASILVIQQHDANLPIGAACSLETEMEIKS